MSQKTTGPRHVCQCPECQAQPDGETAKLHAGINHLVTTLDEKSRRWFAGFWALQLGHGGVQYVATVTGLSRPTITRGLREIARGAPSTERRTRALGGGRKPVEKNRRKSSRHSTKS